MSNEYTKESPSFRLIRKRFSFSEGFASIFDMSNSIGKNRYNEDETSEEADRAALCSDWKTVGFDMYNSLHEYGKEKKES